MKWYNYEYHWINLDKVSYIMKELPNHIYFTIDGKIIHIIYESFEQSEKEFEKIKELMGLNERYYTSRCT